MKNVFYLILIAMLFSCNEDEKINSPIDENPNPEDTIQSCNFEAFEIEFTYKYTLNDANNNVDIFENTKYEVAKGYQKQLRFTITSENLNDTMNNLFAVSIQSACNSTGREFDSENCRFTTRTDFITTKAYCNDLDKFLLERLTGNELTSYNNDTIVVYEEANGWYHYFLSNQEIDEEVKPLPNLRISSNEIYAKDDTLKIPLNINFLKNDSTKCEVFGLEVEPHYYDINNSYVILPECDLGSGNYEMKHFVEFQAFTNQDTIAKIDSILFFRRKSFNNVELRLENIMLKLYSSRSTYHPFYGSTNNVDSTTLSEFGLKIIRNSFGPDIKNPFIFLPLTQTTKDLLLKSISLRTSSGYYRTEGYEFINREISLTDIDLNLVTNLNYYNIKIDDKEFINKVVRISQSLNYSDGNSSSTRISKSMKLGNINYTDSTYLKIVLKREK